MAAVKSQEQQFAEAFSATDVDVDQALSDELATDEDEFTTPRTAEEDDDLARALAAADEHEKKLAEQRAAAEEQDLKLTEVLAVLGDSVDPDVVRTMLESANWDVQVVVNNLLEGAVPSAAAPEPQHSESQSPPRPHVSPRMDHEQLMKKPVRELRAMLDARKIDHSACVEKDDLVSLLEDNWDVEVPPPTPSEPRHGSMPAGFGPFGADPMMAWVQQMAMSGNMFPMSGYSSEGCHQPTSPEEQAELQKQKDEEARVNEERRVEMTTQDLEFQESLLIDQQKAALQREEAEQERQFQEAKRQAIEMAEAAFEAKRLRVSQPEADKGHPERCQIVIRTPNGKRLNRTFLGSDEVAFVYDWIDVCCADEPFTRSSYQLTSRVPGRPSKEICKNSKTLKEEGVEHQTMFFITCAD